MMAWTLKLQYSMVWRIRLSSGGEIGGVQEDKGGEMLALNCHDVQMPREEAELRAKPLGGS